MNVDLSHLTHERDRLDADPEQDRGLQELLDYAREYVADKSWCDEVLEAYLGDGVAPIFAVLLVRIRPSRPRVDEWLWVVVGDLPPLHLVTDKAPTAHDALRIYIQLRDEWIAAVRNGEATDGLAPVDVPAERGWADDLDSRLRFLEREVLSG